MTEQYICGIVKAYPYIPGGGNNVRAYRKNVYIGKQIRVWISLLLVLSLIIAIPCSSSVLAAEVVPTNQEIDEFTPNENETVALAEGNEELDSDENDSEPETNDQELEDQNQEPEDQNQEPENQNQGSENQNQGSEDQNQEPENKELEDQDSEGESSGQEPVITDTDPETTDPETTDPEITDLEITDPETTDLEITDPENTDPEAIKDPENEQLPEEEAAENDAEEDKETVLLTLDGRPVEEFSVNSDYFINPVYYHTADEYAELLEATSEDDIFVGVQAELFALDPSVEDYYLTRSDKEQALITNIDIENSLSYSDGIAKLRQGLVNRLGSIEVTFASGSERMNSTLKLINVLTQHTGNPQEGDYIYYHLRSAYINSSLAVKVDGVWYNTFTLYVNYYTTAEQEYAVGNTIASVLNSLGVYDEYKTEYDKVLLIYQYICTHVVYDNAHVHQADYYPMYTAHAALINGTSVCQGYANLFYRMCLTVGIQARIISGQNHAWNIVKVGNSYYTVDSTWDAARTAHDYNWYLLGKNIGKSNWEDSRSKSTVAGVTISSVNYPCKVNGTQRNADYEAEPVHNFAETEGRDVCSVCGVSRKHVHTEANHSWDEGTVTKEATCTEEGSIVYSCTECGVTRTEVLPVTDHARNEGVITKEPTCTEDGELSYVCTVCGDAITEAIPATGHSWNEGEVTKEATCTEKGLMVWTCTTDGETKEEEIPQLDHEFVLKETVPPTMKEKGYDVLACRLCGKEEQSNYTDPLTGSLTVTVEGAVNGSVAYADGMELVVQDGKITLPNSSVKAFTVVQYNSNEISTNYPIPNSMKVYFVSLDDWGNYQAIRDPAFDGVMQYAGASIRVTGNPGVRIITSVPKNIKSALTGSGINGWTLVEDGTVLGYEENGSNPSLTNSALHNYAYKRGSANPVFKTTDSVEQFTNAVTFSSLDKCRLKLVIRPYMTITKGGETVTLYGGVIHRSIGSIANQNRNAFQAGTPQYEFIYSILNACGMN